MTKVIAVAAGLLLTMGCMHREPAKPDYDPVPDTKLFGQISDLPDVSAVDITFRKQFSYGTGYAGEITVDDGVDAAAVLDHVYAILRQGRSQVDISVRARQGVKQISSRDFGLVSGSPANLEKRYGPQPGDGTPPTDTD